MEVGRASVSMLLFNCKKGQIISLKSAFVEHIVS